MKNFALIGVGGYIAPRHLKAIKETGNNLIVALDKHDSVGILDSYFENVDFFTEFERFDRHVEKLRRKDPDKRVHYVSICSPNYLHDAHIRFSLRVGADAICEKPLVLNPWNLDYLQEMEKETGKRVYTILQLRKHPSVIKLKKEVENSGKKIYDIDLTYITPRGKWYYYSWKGDISKSGGIATNIGIHFFDMLTWIFGEKVQQKVFYSSKQKMGGYLELEKARVRWFLSLDKHDLPPEVIKRDQRTYRSIRIDGKEFEFSSGFTDLHTEVYKDILKGNGFGIEDARPSIEIVHEIRNIRIENGPEEYLHPLVKKNFLEDKSNEIL